MFASRPAFCFLASLVLAGAKTKPNLFTSPKNDFLKFMVLGFIKRPVAREKEGNKIV